MMKKLIVGLLASVTALVAVPAPHARAATSNGHAYPAWFGCQSNRTISEMAPDMTSISGGGEYVAFTRYVYKWNASTATWTPVYAGAGSAAGNKLSYFPIANAFGLTWFSSVADNIGVIGFSATGYPTFAWYSPTGSITIGVGHALPAIGVTPGYYRVQDWYEWQNGALTSVFLSTKTGAAYCQIS